MKSISNSLLASKPNIAEQMTNDSLQELQRLEAITSAFQGRDDSEVEEDEPEMTEEQLLDEMDYEEEYEDNAELTEDDIELEEDDIDVIEDDVDITEDDVDTTEDSLLDELAAQDEIEEDILVQDDTTYEPALNEEEFIEQSEDDVEYNETYSDSLEDGTEYEEAYSDSLEDDTEYDEDEQLLDEMNCEEDEDEQLLDDMDYDEDEDEQPVQPVVRQSIPVRPPVSTPAAFNGTSSAVRPPVSTPVYETQPDDSEDTPDDDLDLDYDLDMDDDYDEQEEDFDYAEGSSDIEEEILEEIEVDEQVEENELYRGSKTANSFEKTDLQSETKTKEEISTSVEKTTDVSEEIDDFLEDTSEDDELDFSVLDDVPLIEQPKQNMETQRLEEENAKLRQQLAQLENERLKQQIEAQQKQQPTSPSNIKLNLGVTIAQQPPQQTVAPTKQPAEQSKEAAQRKRWSKYEAMSTADLWKLVYKFMVMAGVNKAPVKSKILIEEFGARNIKRLEATYIMATKDGYTC